MNSIDRSDIEIVRRAVSHDLRSNLRRIASCVGNVKSELGEAIEENPDSKTWLGFLDDNIEAAALSIEGIADFLKLNLQTPSIKPLHFRTFFENYQESFAGESEERSIILDIDVDDEVEILADKLMLTLLLDKILDNAITYNTSSKIKVRILLRQDDAATELVIEDNGIGIDEQFIAKAMEPLGRLHSASEYPGAGFGLNIAEKVAQHHGWTLSLSSMSNGVKVTVKMPQRK